MVLGIFLSEAKSNFFYHCCTDLTKQKEVAGLILNAQQAVLFHFLRDDTESTIVTRMNTYDFTRPETNNLEKLCKDILKLINQVENNLNCNWVRHNIFCIVKPSYGISHKNDTLGLHVFYLFLYSFNKLCSHLVKMSVGTGIMINKFVAIWLG